MKWLKDFLNQEWPSEMKKFAERLKSSLEEGADVERICAEIEERISPAEYPSGREVVLEVAIESAVFSEKKRDTKEGPNGVKEIKDAQKKVVGKIQKLIDALNDLEAIQAKGPIKRKACVSPERLIVKAGLRMTGAARGKILGDETVMPGRDRRNFFKEEVAPLFGEISKRLENKIPGAMPTMQEVLAALKDEIEKEEKNIKTDPCKDTSIFKERMAGYAFKSRKSEVTADFIRVFLYELNTQKILGRPPLDFAISPETVGKLAGCLFDLEGGVSIAAVKKVIEREMEKINGA